MLPFDLYWILDYFCLSNNYYVEFSAKLFDEVTIKNLKEFNIFGEEDQELKGENICSFNLLKLSDILSKS